MLLFLYGVEYNWFHYTIGAITTKLHFITIKKSTTPYSVFFILLLLGTYLINIFLLVSRGNLRVRMVWVSIKIKLILDL